MKKTIRIISIILLVISLILLPFLGIGILFGLAGSTSQYYIIIAIGYIGVVIFSFISIFKYKFFPLIIIAIILFIIGFTFDSRFWAKENQDICEQLRANPTCIEDECGFDCSDFPSGSGLGFTTSGAICDNKDMSLCAEKRIQATNDEKITTEAIDSFSNIVDKITSSSNPSSENFEDQLVAIYNCLELKYGPGAQGELMAVQVLKEKNLSQEELNKYYDYLAAHGRNPNRQVIVAALPNGDKNLSCENINY